MPETTPVAVIGTVPGHEALARWLRLPEQARTAVLLNEAAAPAVVHPMVATFADSPRHPFGGCLCCARPGGLTGALRALLPRARRGEIDRVVVVAADRSRVLTALASDPVVAAVYRPGAAIEAVDA